MKKLLKVLAVLMSVAMLTALCACDSSKNAGSSNVDEITIWTGDSHSKNVMKSLVDEFNNTQGKELGVKIVYSVKEGDYAQTLDLAIASNQAPDMFLCFSTQKYAENGDIIALNDIKGGQEYIDSIFDEEAKRVFITSFDGKTYKVPYYVNTFGLIYNEDMFKAKGLVDDEGNAKAPETYDEFVEYAKKLTDKDKNEYGLILPFKSTNAYSHFLNMTFASRGEKGYNPITGEYDYTVVEPAFDTLLKMKNNGSIYPGEESLDNDMARALFGEGKIGMIFGGSYDVAVLTSQFPAKCNWSVAQLPLESKEKAYLQRMANSGGLVINKKSVERIGEDKIFEVFKWFHSDEVLQDLYEQGISIPYNSKVIEKAKVKDDIHKAWSIFGSFREISMEYPSEMPTDLEGTPSFADIFKTNIWPEQGNMHDLLVDLNKRSNEGVAKKFAVNDNLKRENYIIEGYNTER